MCACVCECVGVRACVCVSVYVRVWVMDELNQGSDKISSTLINYLQLCSHFLCSVCTLFSSLPPVVNVQIRKREVRPSPQDFLKSRVIVIYK